MTLQQKLYMSINERGLTRGYTNRLLHTAVRTAAANTDLSINLLYSGNEHQNLQPLRDKGVNVIFHKLSFDDQLRSSYGDDYDKFNAHWLRTELPMIENERNIVLYTDIDVLFSSKFQFPQIEPDFLAAAPEHSKDNYGYFNSGVMVLNIENLRDIHDAFIGCIVERLKRNFKYPTHDQKSFNEYFNGLWDRLPLAYNWKPYWGVNRDVQILHFHGPKPEVARQVLDGGDFPNNLTKTMMNRSIEGYRYYVNQWEELIKTKDEANETAETRLKIIEAQRKRDTHRINIEAQRMLAASEAQILDVAVKVLDKTRRVRFAQVGANDGKIRDPIARYVTDLQWTGLLVEPVPDAFSQLNKTVQGNPALVIERVAIGSSGQSKMFLPADGNTRIASFSEDHVRRRYGKHIEVRTIEVKTEPLSELLVRHDLTSIDFLFSSTEGFDDQVLYTLDWNKSHPLVIFYASASLMERDREGLQTFLERQGYWTAQLHTNSIAISGRLAEAGWLASLDELIKGYRRLAALATEEQATLFNGPSLQARSQS